MFGFNVSFFNISAPIARNGTDEIYGVVSGGFDCNKPIHSRIGIYSVVNSQFIYPFISETLAGRYIDLLLDYYND